MSFYSILINKSIYYFKNTLGRIALNVSVVYDVFAVAIKEHGAFQQPQKCGGEKPTKGASPTVFFS
jgi:hypothetical protein